MEMKDKSKRISQFSPEAERLIRSRQKSPIYLKLAALVQQDEYVNGYTQSNRIDTPEEDQKRGEVNTLINYLTKIFTGGNEQ